jgi:hypothetical protein
MTLRSWQLATLAFFIPALALAQDPPNSAELVARLRSPSRATVASAAFYARAQQVKEVVPELIAILEALPSGSQDERDYLAAAVLDALIQIRPGPGEPPGTEVPPTAVARYLDRWPIQTLIPLVAPARNEIPL